jgi:hypothetical protein
VILETRLYLTQLGGHLAGKVSLLKSQVRRQQLKVMVPRVFRWVSFNVFRHSQGSQHVHRHWQQST